MDRRLAPFVLALIALLLGAGIYFQTRAHAAAPAKKPKGQTSHPKTPQPPPPAVPVSGNELGIVPVLEYHRMGTTEGRWQRTPQGLLADLTWLYDHNFRPVTFLQYATGNINLPKGMHPVVLTFDDGDPSQFQWNQAHIPAPDSSVGVLWEFHQTHPDWALSGTFFVNADPFGSDSVAKLQWLVAHGFEIGNHTYTHANLNKLDVAGIEKEIGEEEAYIETAVPGYVPQTFALPFGGLATSPAERQATLTGSYQGTSWDFKGIALVGANPTPSPYSRNFNPDGIARIQVADPSTAPGSERWLLVGWESYFTANPTLLYVSDGNPAYITYPSSWASQLNPGNSQRANPLP